MTGRPVKTIDLANDTEAMPVARPILSALSEHLPTTRVFTFADNEHEDLYAYHFAEAILTAALLGQLSGQTDGLSNLLYECNITPERMNLVQESDVDAWVTSGQDSFKEAKHRITDELHNNYKINSDQDGYRAIVNKQEATLINFIPPHAMISELARPTQLPKSGLMFLDYTRVGLMCCPDTHAKELMTPRMFDAVEWMEGTQLAKGIVIVLSAIRVGRQTTVLKRPSDSAVGEASSFTVQQVTTSDLRHAHLPVDILLSQLTDESVTSLHLQIPALVTYLKQLQPYANSMRQYYTPPGQPASSTEDAAAD